MISSIVIEFTCRFDKQEIYTPVDSPWKLTDQVTGLHFTSPTLCQLIAIFFPGCSWRSISPSLPWKITRHSRWTNLLRTILLRIWDATFGGRADKGYDLSGGLDTQSRVRVVVPKWSIYVSCLRPFNKSVIWITWRSNTITTRRLQNWPVHWALKLSLVSLYLDFFIF